MIASIILLLALLISPQQQRPQSPPGAPPQSGQAEAQKPAPLPDEPPVMTKHEIKAGGKTLRYSVMTGFMPIKNNQGETEARIFFIAYTLENPGSAAQRPLMFSFNGGPGSSSVWLHLGALGPKRVRMLDDGQLPAPPYQLVDNDYTWLDKTDLVFIDPVGTGYSRAASPQLAQKFFGLAGRSAIGQ